MALTLRKPFTWVASLGQYIGILNVILIAIAVGYILLFLVLAVIRLNYPFELEWIEGAYIDEARWIAEGIFPYQPPSIQFIPTSKTPFFFYLSAFLMKWLEVGFFAPRLVSILATLGCLFILFRITWEEGRLLLPAVISAGLYAASYRFSGAWMDIAKTDALFLFLVLAAFYLGRRYQTWWGGLVSGGLFVLAYFTKQLTLPVVLILAPVSLLVSRGRTWLMWLFAGILGLAVFIYFDRISNGWFSFYTFDIVTSHGKATDYILFWKKFLPVMFPALLLALYYGYLVIARSKLVPLILPTRMWENAGLGAALVLTSWSIYLKTWTYDNAMMMACLGISLLAGLALVEIYRPNGLGEQSQRNVTGWRTYASILLLMQFLFLVYNPMDQLPKREDRVAAQAFLKRVEGLSGEVLLFNHGFMNDQAGKTQYLHGAPYSDMVSGFDWNATSETQQRKALVKDSLDQAIESQVFDWVILDQPERNWTPYYVYVEDLSVVPGVFYPVTGAPTRPESLLIKNPIPSGGLLPLNDERFNTFFVDGWSDPQEWGRWMESEKAMVHISLEKNEYLLKIRARPYCVDDQTIARRLLIGWNEHVYFETEITGCDPDIYQFYIPETKIANGLNDLWLQISTDDQNRETTIIRPGAPLAAVYSIEFIQD